jgi:hypothetical protein
VFLSQRQFNPLSKIRLPVPQLIVLGFFFLIASCSTQGPSRTADIYPDKPKRYGEQRDLKFDYRKDRLRAKEKEVEPPLKSIADLKGFADDMDPASLGRVIDNQLAVMFEQDPGSPVRLGDFTLTRGRLVETLEAFQKLLQKNLPQEEFNKKVSEKFLLYRVGKGKNKKVLFTGYYRPVITASPTPSPRYRFPIYQMPDEDFHLNPSDLKNV